MGFRFNGTEDKEKIIRVLMQSGLSKQQASSSTAREVVRLFAKDNQVGVDVLQAEIEEMQRDILRYRAEIMKLDSASKTAENLLEKIESVNNLSNELTDDKAKNAITLYSAIIQIGTHQGADINQVIENAGYIVYAYLGGQAKREQLFMKDIQ